MSALHDDGSSGRELVRGLVGAHRCSRCHIDLRVAGFSGGSFDLACRLRQAGQVWTIATNTNGTWMLLEIKRKSSVAMSIGQPGGPIAAHAPLALVEQVAVYVPTWVEPAGKEACISWVQAHREELRAVALTGEERLMIARNKVLAGIYPSSPSTFVQRVEAIGNLVTALPGEAVEPTSGKAATVRLPAGLESLTKLAETWAMSDDDERSGRIAVASDDALNDLVDRVTPQFDAINAMLDDADEPLSPELLAASSLGEVATEARIERARRRAAQSGE